MRALADAPRIRQFMRALGDEVRTGARAYLTGGATAVLLGWRISTVDVDVRFVPDLDEILRAIPRLKETLDLPAIHGPSFRRAVHEAFGPGRSG